MKRLLGLLLVGAGAGGCGGDVCDRCTEGVNCTEVFHVPRDYALDEAAAAATPGSCIALAAGTHGEVTLTSGVSLLGADAAEVTVGSVTVEPGSATMLRGLHVAGVVKLRADAREVHMERLLVTGSRNGVQAESGASFTLLASELRGVPDNAVLAVDAARITIRDTRIVDSGGPGLWAQCSAGCGCPAPPQVELARVELRNNHTVGVALHAVQADFEDVLIAEATAGALTQYGGGLSVAACSDLSARGLTVDGADTFGVLVDNSTAKLGFGDDDKGIIIINNKVGGIWLQNIDSSVTVENATVTGNGVSGINVGASSKGIIIINNKVGATAAQITAALGYTSGQPSPVGAISIGDGLIWSEGAEVHIDGLTLSGNARNSFLIDGPVPAGSTIQNVTLDSGDEQKGIVQQRVTLMSDIPETTNAPQVEPTDTAPYAVPVSPAPPQAIAAE
jgi:hypothetical protein